MSIWLIIPLLYHIFIQPCFYQWNFDSHFMLCSAKKIKIFDENAVLDLQIDERILWNFVIYYCYKKLKCFIRLQYKNTFRHNPYQELYLHGNELSTLESAPLCLPVYLQVLSLADNKISDIGQLAYLTRLKWVIYTQCVSCKSSSGVLFTAHKNNGSWHLEVNIVTNYLRMRYYIS